MWATRVVRVDIRETEIDEGNDLGYYVSAGDAVLLSPVDQRHGGALHPVSPPAEHRVELPCGLWTR